MKITIPKSEVISSGSLTDFYDDLIKVQSGLTISNDDLNVYIVNGNINLNIGEVAQILNAGGEVEEYLMAIRSDYPLLTDNVPSALPNAETFTAVARNFENWFDSTCELWKKDDNTQIYFLTNPLGTSMSQYLKGSEIKLLFDSFGGATPSVINRHLVVRTITQFNSEVSTGWTRIN